MELTIKEKLTVDTIPTDKRWQKYLLGADFIRSIQKNLASILTEKASEGFKSAINALEREFVSKCAVASWKECQTLISLFGLVCKYLREIFNAEETPEKKIHLLRGLINSAISISKDFPFRNSALWKVNKHVQFSSLFKTFGDNVEFLRLVSNFFILRQRKVFLDEDQQVADAIIKLLPLVDTTTQGCLVAAGMAILNSGFLSDHEFCDATIQYLNAPDPSLCKLMIALKLPAKITRGKEERTSDHTSTFVQVLADYVKWCGEYEAAVKESSFNVNLVKLVASCARKFKGHEYTFLEQSLSNLKQQPRNTNATHHAVEMLLIFTLTSPQLPGTKIIDLPDLATDLYTALITMDHIWSNPLVCDTLARYDLPSTREAMVQFIENKGTEGPKRFPTFKTIDSVPWSTLEHAYGSAENVPKRLCHLASWEPEQRESALQGLRHSITHQGQCYGATPHVVPFFLELVEASLVQDKHKILRFCIQMLTGRVDYFLTNVEGLDLVASWRPYPDILQIRLAIEQKFTENLTRIIRLLSNESRKIRGCAAHLLGLLPKSAHESVPKLRERYDIETDSKVKASLLVSLSLLWPQFDEDWTSFVTFAKHEFALYRGTDALDLEFAAFASLVRMYDFTETSLKWEFRRFLMESDKITQKRENYVITSPIEFILRSIRDNCLDGQLLPLVIQHLQSDDYDIASEACKTMMRLAFRSVVFGSHKRRLHSEVASQEQIMVVTKAAEYYHNCGRNWNMQDSGLPNDVDTCKLFLAEAQVIEDLYGGP